MEWLKKEVINSIKQQPTEETPKILAKILKFRKRRRTLKREYKDMKKIIFLIAIFLSLPLLALGTFYSYGQDVGVITRNNPDGSETPVAIIELATEQVYQIEDDSEWYDDAGPRVMTRNNPDGSETPVAIIELGTEQVYQIEEVYPIGEDMEWYDDVGPWVYHHPYTRKGGIRRDRRFYPPVNVNGGVANPQAGFYPRVKDGVIDTRTGRFIPLIP